MPAQINLLPKKGFASTIGGQLLRFSTTYGRYIVVGVQLIVLIAFFSRFRLDRELTDLQESVDQKKAIVASLSDFESEIRNLQVKIKNIRDIQSQQDKIRNYLFTLKEIIPPGNVVTSIEISLDGVQVSGRSVDENSFSQLLASLNTTDEFSEIELGNIAQLENSTAISFSFTALDANREVSDIRPPEAPVD